MGVPVATGNALPAYIKPPKNFWADLLLDWASKGVYPGAETPVTLDAVDEVDAGDVVDGFGGDGWGRVRRVRRVVWWFLHADEQMETSGNGLSHTAAR